MTIKVIVNGFEEEVGVGTRVDDLIDRFGERDPGLIVEINGRFVHASDYGQRILNPGDRVEMIHPAFGG